MNFMGDVSYGVHGWAMGLHLHCWVERTTPMAVALL